VRDEQGVELARGERLGDAVGSGHVGHVNSCLSRASAAR
jgi:hypothetical protein